MTDLLKFIFTSEEMPPSYGALHIVSILLVIGGSVIAAIYGKRLTDGRVRRLLLIVWILLILGEIYREAALGTSFNEDQISYSYPWYLFPFQFCSSPLYALPFVIFLPSGKTRDAFMAFLCTFCLFGGLAVMVYPGDVLHPIIGVSLQAMLHHGAQVVIGVLTVAVNRHRLGKRFYLKSIIVFSGFVATAMALNVSVYHIFSRLGMPDTFNMYFISPYFPTSLPILSTIQQNGAPHIVILLLYITVFSVAAMLVALVEYFSLKVLSRIRRHP